MNPFTKFQSSFEIHQSNKSILSPKNIYGIILSAGLSGRMGKFKPLLEYKGESFIQNIILKLSRVCDRVTIVTGYKAEEVKINLEQLSLNNNIDLVFNRNYEKGMFTSLQKGISEAKNCDWILYHFVDQPGLPDEFYPDFIGQIDNNYNWIQPVNKEQRGHPILIQKELFGLILEAPDHSNLRKISNNPKVKKKFWECGFEEIFQDIDTEEDYQMLD